MDYFKLEFFGLTRKLPIVALSPRLKIASLNLLGDVELVDKASKRLADKLKATEFDYLVGPEVKVLPLIHQLSILTNKKHYVICRKNIMGYMVNPLCATNEPKLVVDGADAAILKGKRVVIVDDVVSTGRTIAALKDLMGKVGAEVVAVAAIFKQGQSPEPAGTIFLGQLPLF